MNKDKTSFKSRILWFILLYVASVAVVAGVAYFIKFVFRI